MIQDTVPIAEGALGTLACEINERSSNARRANDSGKAKRAPTQTCQRPKKAIES